MVKILFLLHRYLGITIGLVMLLWTMSGIIMMYKQYPEIDHWEASSLKKNIELDNCCKLPSSQILLDESFSKVQLEMLNSEPVLRLNTKDRGLISYQLSSGIAFNSIDQSRAKDIAENFVSDHYPGSAITGSFTLDNDQWTVSSRYHNHRPLFKFGLDNSESTEFYISSHTGSIVQITTSDQRLWGYLGAVIHWLYPTMLRQNTAVWAQVVIWLTIVGIFLTVTGLYIGIHQFWKRRNGRLSPYRGIVLYHHYSGLIFGILTLTWVASGLLSMNPWGMLEGEGIADEYQRMTERELTWPEVEQVLTRLDTAPMTPDTVQLDISVMAGEVSVIAHERNGNKQRLHPESLQAYPYSLDELENLARRLQPDSLITSMQLITAADYYYYVHHEPREFPVYRVIIGDSQRRHYYLSPADGHILLKVDSNLRWYRWLFNGFHRGDFNKLTRSRPFWDSFMLSFLIGVTLVCGTGSYMGIRRLRIDLSRKRRDNKQTGSKVSEPMP
ncbi:MAG: PepSY domain-containing protein [Gammaproteobacteria bacterium]|nr:PepSY domain-containing protein [Gammaproteobacteria bacterium]